MKNFSIITIIVLIVLNIFMYYNFTNYKNNTTKKLLEGAINKLSSEKKVDNIRKLLLLQYQLNGKYIDSVFTFRQPYVKNSVILLFSEKHCKSCVKKILQELYFLNEKSKFNNFILVGYYENKAIFNATADSLDYKFRHEFISKKKRNLKIFKHPTVFIIDNNYQIRLLYVYDDFPDMIFTYFRKILPNYLMTVRNNIKLKPITK